MEDSPVDEVDFGGCIARQDKKYIYNPQVHIFLQSTQIWELNRPLDDMHIRNILECWEAEFIAKGWITVFGTFVVVVDDVGNKLVIDGQHRTECLRRLVKKCPQINATRLLVEVFYTEEGGIDEIIGLFQKINNLKPQEPKTNEAFRDVDILLKIIKKKFPGCIKDSKSAHRPHATSKQIKDTLWNKGMLSKTENEILDYLDEVNKKLRDTNMDTIFGSERTKDPKKCLRIMEKANELGFYLSLRKPKNGMLVW